MDSPAPVQPLAVGAEGISKAVGIKIWTVYNLRRIPGCPIHNSYGVGLVADPEELKAWIIAQRKQKNVSKEKRPA
jgi:hypothetical protein